MKKLLFLINVDWYYRLHWEERILSAMTDGFEVHVCMAREDGRPLPADFGPREHDGRPIRYHDIPLHRTSTGPWSNIRSYLALRRIVDEVRPDLIHTATIKPNILGGILARPGRRPIVLTLPGLGTVFSIDSARNKLIRGGILALYRFIAGNPRSRFVFENRDDLRLFRREGVLGEDRGEVVPGAGVDTDRYRPAPRACPPTPLTILFAARLLRQKGLDDLAEAVARLRREGMEVELLVAGIEDPAAPDAIPIAQIRAWHDEGRLRWLGRVDDMVGLLGRVHLVALPTRYGEGIPRILIEAAACGLPVVTTDVAGCRDFVLEGRTGRLVPPGDVDRLASALRELADEGVRNLYGKAARQRVEDGYSRAHVIGTFKEIYRRALD